MPNELWGEITTEWKPITYNGDASYIVAVQNRNLRKKRGDLSPVVRQNGLTIVIIMNNTVFSLLLFYVPTLTSQDTLLSL